MQENLPLVGTPAFASINSHRGLQLGRRDDIKSLAYSLIFLHRGLLPWLTRDGKSPSFPTTLTCKQNFLVDAVNGAHDIPIELATIFRHARSLTFTEKPNYGYLRTILENAVETTEQPLPPHPTPDLCAVTSTPVVNILTSTSKSIIFTPERKAHTKSTKEVTPRQV
jgi:casein kinase 1